MIDLSQVTLVCFENREHQKAIELIADMIKIARFGDVRWLTEHRTLKEFQHAEFHIGKNCKTTHLLTVHLDGFILDPDQWTPDWLQYDYIGAPWPEGYMYQFNPAWTGRVGNSGFSLRSARLCMRAAALESRYGVFDLLVSHVARTQLGNEGFKFAPVEEAAKFSVEIPCPETPSKTFGFHGVWPLSLNQPSYYSIGTCAKQALESAARKAAAAQERVILLTAHGPENDRTKFAMATHTNAETHVVKVLHRNASEIGDERGCYFVKDVLDFSLSLSGDIFCYVNNDVALVPEWKEKMLPAVRQYGCYCSQRIDLKKFDKPLRFADLNNSKHRAYIGTDFFAFTPKWWAEHRDNFPDKVMLGGEGWDAVLTWLMWKSGFVRGDVICYHEAHANWWSNRDNLAKHPAQLANREAQIDWAKRNKVESLLNAPGDYLWRTGIFGPR